VDELEDLLRRYRPIGPPFELRERAIRQPRRGREWLLPAAAAAAALFFYLLTDVTRRRLDELQVDVDREAALIELTEELGGDEIARLQAEHLMNTIDSIQRAERVAPALELTPGVTP
jgi:hypothetical protein